MAYAYGVQRAQRGPGAVDVVHAPATKPASVLLLLAQDVVDSALQLRACSDGLAQLRKHRDTASADINSGRIEKRAMVRERNVVEIQMRVVGVEGGPSAVLALQAGNPLVPAADRGAIVLPAAGKVRCPIHRHD